MCEDTKALAAALDLGSNHVRPEVTLTNEDDVRPFFTVKSPGTDEQPGSVQFVKSDFHAPTFKEGSVKVLDVPSFGAYFKLHSNDSTMVRASTSKSEVEALLDWHSPEFPGRGAHSLTLVCQKTPEWQKLKAASGQTFGQSQFADFIDDLTHCFETPDPAALAEIVLNLEGANNVAWNSRIDRVSGGVQIAYTEDAQAKTKAGVLFPTQGTVACPIFIGGPSMQFLVKFRYRVNEGNLKVGFVLDQTDRWEREAFLGTVKQVADATDAVVLLGP